LSVRRFRRDIALLAVTMLANLTAILLRNRYEKRW
jgi:hypothetical protein